MNDLEQTRLIRELRKKGPDAVYEYFIENNFINEELIEVIKKASKKDIIGPNYPYPQKINRVDYEKQKYDLQQELVKWQNTIKRTGQKVILLFEGRDAAGKGGTIKRFTEHINPRGARVVALDKPTEEEQGQWYFQRYVEHFPTAGEVVFFDRSWYNRAGVEKVMDYCSDEDYFAFSSSVATFEELLSRSGITLIKFWFSVSREEQLRRFMGRILNPLKRWKISPTDIASLKHWGSYTEAKESMFFYSDTAANPWTIVRSDDKKRARLNAIRHVLCQFDYEGKDERRLQAVDPKIVGRPGDLLGSHKLNPQGNPLLTLL